MPADWAVALVICHDENDVWLVGRTEKVGEKKGEKE